VLAVGCQGEEPVADGNAEYEALMALGADARGAAAELCPPPAQDTPGPVAIRYGTARVTRRLGPRRVELEVRGRAARGGEGGERIDPVARCGGLIEASFSRQKGQWFVDELRVRRRDAAGP
jgi:hypothetical protein